MISASIIISSFFFLFFLVSILHEVALMSGF